MLYRNIMVRIDIPYLFLNSVLASTFIGGMFMATRQSTFMATCLVAVPNAELRTETLLVHSWRHGQRHSWRHQSMVYLGYPLCRTTHWDIHGDMTVQQNYKKGLYNEIISIIIYVISYFHRWRQLWNSISLSFIGRGRTQSRPRIGLMIILFIYNCVGTCIYSGLDY